MKAPDKIYLGIDELDSGYVYDLSLDNNGHPEYIRKEALLKWANESRKEIKELADAGDAFYIGYSCGIRDLIDKLNSM